jgi:hypothetical protein
MINEAESFVYRNRLAPPFKIGGPSIYDMPELAQ